MKKEDLKQFTKEYYEIDPTLFSSSESIRKIINFLEDPKASSLVLGVENIIKRKIIFKNLSDFDFKATEDLIDRLKKIKLTISNKQLRLFCIPASERELIGREYTELKKQLMSLSDEEFDLKCNIFIEIAKEYRAKARERDVILELNNSHKCYNKEKMSKYKLAKQLDKETYKYFTQLKISEYLLEILTDEMISLIKVTPKEGFKYFGRTITNRYSNYRKCEMIDLFRICSIMDPKDKDYEEVMDFISLYYTNENSKVFYELITKKLWFIEVEKSTEYLNTITERRKHPAIRFLSNGNLNAFNSVAKHLDNMDFIEILFYITKSYPTRIFDIKLDFFHKISPELFEIVVKIYKIYIKKPQLFSNREIEEILEIKNIKTLESVLELLNEGFSLDEIPSFSFAEELAKSTSLTSALELIDSIDSSQINDQTLVKKVK